MRVYEPSDRNWQVFFRIEEERRPLREVAEEFGVCPTRVGQIVRQVQNFLLATTPKWAAQEDAACQAYVAARLHQERLMHCMGTAMELFRRSQGEQTVATFAPDPQGVQQQRVTVRSSNGDMRYLNAYIRFSERLSKAKVDLALLTKRLPPPPVDESVEIVPCPANASDDLPEEAYSPNGVCAPAVENASTEDNRHASGGILTASNKITCVEDGEELEALERLVTARVQNKKAQGGKLTKQDLSELLAESLGVLPAPWLAE